MSFDYGTEVGDVTQEYREWPVEGQLTALIDADIIPYNIGFTIKEEQYVSGLAKAMTITKEDRYEPEELKDGIDDLYYKALLTTSEFQEITKRVISMVNSWIQSSDADSAKFYISGKNNFRDDVAFTTRYKGNRFDKDGNPKPKPPFFYEIKRWLTERYPPIIIDGIEADDALSMEQYSRLLKYDDNGNDVVSDMSGTIIITIDKDLCMVPGWHYNPRTRNKHFVLTLGELFPKWSDKRVPAYSKFPLVNGEPIPPDIVIEHKMEPDIYIRGKNKGKIKTKRVQVGMELSKALDKCTGTGLKFFYYQIIVGDTADNYGGLKGVGKTKAFEIIQSCLDEKELYFAVLAQYKLVYGEGKHIAANWRGGATLMTAYQRMLEQGRLAWMLSKPGEVWRGQHNCPLGTDKIWD